MGLREHASVIVCIGDSITYGQRLPLHQRAWPLLITRHRIISHGVPGDTTRLALDRFPSDVQSLRPDGVIIQFGHNDCNRWQTDLGLPRVSQRAFAANLEEMVIRCRTFGAHPFLCSLTPSFRNKTHTEDSMIYDHIVRGVADDFHVTLIDVRSAFIGQDGLLMEDGLHITGDGHIVYASVVQRALDAWSEA